MRGWSSLVCLQLIFSGAILTAIGLVGDYVARIYEETKGRPLYVISEAVNVSPGGPPPARGLYLAPGSTQARPPQMTDNDGLAPALANQFIISSITGSPP